MTLVRAFLSRPRLLSAIAVGVAAAGILYAIPTENLPSTRAILAWDAGCAWFIASVLWMMRGQDGAGISSKAAAQDEGRHMILFLVVAAAAASLGAIAVELSQAKGEDGLEKALRVAVAIGTVAASWFVVQLIFAVHYAHDYYAMQKDGKPRGGLLFPGGEEPDYWDFLHFAVIIGVAAQTADIAFTSKRLRRIGTLHGVVAFTFNTVVLALTINLIAGLF